MSEFLRFIQEFRKDMKTLIDTLRSLISKIGSIDKLITRLDTLDKAIITLDKLQKTLAANEGHLPELIKELKETNKNINTLLDIIKAMKEE